MAAKHPGKSAYIQNEKILDREANAYVRQCINNAMNGKKKAYEAKGETTPEVLWDTIVVRTTCSRKGSYHVDIILWVNYGAFAIKKMGGFSKMLPPLMDDSNKYREALLNNTKETCKIASVHLVKTIGSIEEAEAELSDGNENKSIKFADGTRPDGFKNNGKRLLIDYFKPYWVLNELRFKAILRQTMEKRIEQETALYSDNPNVTCMKLVDCSAEFKLIHGMRFSIEAEAVVSFDGLEAKFTNSEKIKTAPIFKEYRYGETATIAAMEDRFITGIQDVTNKIFQDACFVLSNPIKEKSKEFSNIFDSIQDWDRNVYGELSAQYVNKLNNPIIYSNNKKTASFTALSVGEKTRLIYGNPLCPKRRVNIDMDAYMEEKETPYTLDNPMPRNVFAFSSFLNLAEALYKEKLTENNLNVNHARRIRFLFQDGFVDSYTIISPYNSYSSDKSQRLRDRQSTQSAREILLEIIDIAIDGEKKDLKRDIEIADKVTSLNINFIEMAILQYMAKGQRLHDNLFWNHVKTNPEVYDAAKGRAVDRLLNLSVEYEDETCTLIEQETACNRTSYYRYQYTEYHFSLGELINSKVLALVKVKQIGAEEIVEMPPKTRMKYLKESAEVSTGKDALWDVLHMVEALPKTQAVEFTKSEAGREFFSKFTGEDAIYAKYFVEELPGCKKLAKEIFLENRE